MRSERAGLTRTKRGREIKQQEDRLGAQDEGLMEIIYLATLAARPLADGQRGWVEEMGRGRIVLV
jgi:hypothetical protein